MAELKSIDYLADPSNFRNPDIEFLSYILDTEPEILDVGPLGLRRKDLLALLFFYHGFNLSQRLTKVATMDVAEKFDWGHGQTFDQMTPGRPVVLTSGIDSFFAPSYNRVQPSVVLARPLLGYSKLPPNRWIGECHQLSRRFELSSMGAGAADMFVNKFELPGVHQSVGSGKYRGALCFPEGWDSPSKNGRNGNEFQAFIGKPVSY